MKVCIVSFDGLEYTLVEKFGIKNLKQTEYGMIDLQPYFEGGGGQWKSVGKGEKVKMALTDEVYATFITGRTPDEHGVTTQREEVNPILVFDKTHLFHLPRSMAIDVPMINCGTTREIHRQSLKKYLQGQLSLDELETELYGYVRSVQELFSVMGFADKDLSMIYFWFSDLLGHAYIDNIDELEQMYLVCNAVVDRIFTLSPNSLHLIVSDHGMLHGEHTPYGFYSVNKKLGLGTVKITEWFNLIRGWWQEEDRKRLVLEHLEGLGYF